MSQQAFYFDGTRCTGCKTCEMACKDFKDLGLGLALRKVYEVTLGKTTMDGEGAVNTTCVSYPVSMACNHCDAPACVAVCPQGAISKDEESGLVITDVEACIGCGSCVEACPYNAPVLDTEAMKSAKCDGCADRVAAGEKPVCVGACPARALDFGDVEAVAKQGEQAAIAPLPDPAETTPNFYISPSSDAQPFDSKDALLANPLEVM